MNEEQNIPEESDEQKDVNENNSQPEIIQPTTLNPPHNKEYMETHAHSHTPRKKWTHYFWEFFMLFLAVFCGFLAENAREQIVEHHRENKYAQLLFEDLKKDTTWLHVVSWTKNWRTQKLDSLVYFLRSPELQKNADRIYYYTAHLSIDMSFTPSQATFQQLRSSGNLRYFSNQVLYNDITQYYDDCLFYLDWENKWLEKKIPHTLSAKLFDMDKLLSLIGINMDIKKAIQPTVGDYKLLSIDKNIINEFMAYPKSAIISNKLSIALLHDMLEPELNKLLTDLKNEYHLK